MRHVGDHVAHGLGAAGHLQADVEALAQTERALPVGDGGAGDIEREAHTDLAGQLQPLLADVGDHDVAGAGMPGHGRGHQTDRTRAGDQDVLADERERQRGVHGVAERVEDRGHVEVDGHPVHPDVGGGQSHVLGERPGPAHTQPHGGPAQMAAARLAVTALAAHQMALAAHPVTDADVGDVPPGLDDLADELVAEHERGADGLPRPAVPGPDVQVGAADTGAQHLDQYVAGPDGGLRDVREPQPGLRLLFDQRLHRYGSCG